MQVHEEFKTPAGRLREAGAKEILRLRASTPRLTYQQIAFQLGVSVGTVFNVCKARTWSWLGGETPAAAESS